jgi:hypothetical protein
MAAASAIEQLAARRRPRYRSVCKLTTLRVKLPGEPSVRGVAAGLSNPPSRTCAVPRLTRGLSLLSSCTARAVRPRPNPQDLPPDFPARLRDFSQQLNGGTGPLLSAMYVRRGCIEMVLELVAAAPRQREEPLQGDAGRRDVARKRSRDQGPRCGWATVRARGCGPTAASSASTYTYTLRYIHTFDMSEPRRSDRKRTQTQFQGATETLGGGRDQRSERRARAATVAKAYEPLGGLVQLGEAGGDGGRVWVGQPDSCVR